MKLISQTRLENTEKNTVQKGHNIKPNPRLDIVDRSKEGLKHLSKVLTYYNMKRYDESMIQLNKSIKMYPKQDQAHCLSALILTKQKKFEEAKNVMENAMKIAFSIHQTDKTFKTNDIGTELEFYTKGFLFFKQGNFSSSHYFLSHSLKLSEESKGEEYNGIDRNEGEYNGRRFYYIARSMIKIGIKTEVEKAEIKKKLTETINANKKWSKAYYRRAEYYLSLLKSNQLNEEEKGEDLVLSDLQSSLHYNSSSPPIYQLSTEKIDLIRHSIQLNIHNRFPSSNPIQENTQEKNDNNNNDNQENDLINYDNDKNNDNNQHKNINEINANSNDNNNSNKDDNLWYGKVYSLMDLKVNSSDEEIDLFIDRLLPYLGSYSTDQICIVCIVLFGIEFTIIRKSENIYQMSRDKVYQLPFSNSSDTISLTFPYSSPDQIRLLFHLNYIFAFIILII